MHIMFCYVVLWWIQVYSLHEKSIWRNQGGIVWILYWEKNHIRIVVVVHVCNSVVFENVVYLKD